MTLHEFFEAFLTGMRQTTWLEYLAVFAGIASVWYSRKEHILVYPVGLINTIIYIYLSFKFHLPGEASVNFYYTVMSIYGWYMWMKKDDKKEEVLLRVTWSDTTMIRNQFLFFGAFFVVIFAAETFLKHIFFEGVIPWADAFASATAFTGMWLMTRKKVESWYWWIATNITSIPLYFTKGLVFTSVYYIVLLFMAVFGLVEWIKRAKQRHA